MHGLGTRNALQTRRACQRQASILPLASLQRPLPV